MKISELIKILEEVKFVEGDLPVYILWDWSSPVVDMEVCPEYKDLNAKELKFDSNWLPKRVELWPK